MKENSVSMGLKLDLLDEKREQATIILAHQKDQATKFYNAHVFHHKFKLGTWS